jgi:hypothetical protein
VNAALPRLGLIVALASLAACRTVGPDYALPEGSAFKRPQANAAFIDTQNPQVAANQALPDRWWSLYNDPVLDGLITQALRDNVELKAADAHLRRAAAVYEQALDAGGFEYEAEAGVSRAQLSAESFLQEHELPVINLADGKFAVSYQFDLFGKLKRGAEAARADEQSVAAARDLAQVSVVAQVADSYLEICHANHELHVAEHSLQLQQRSRTVTERLIAAGRGTPPELARANAQVALLEAALPPLRAQRSAAAYSLAALLGQTPGQLPAGVIDCAHAPAWRSRCRSVMAARCCSAAGRAPGRTQAGLGHRADWRRHRRAVPGHPPGCLGGAAGLLEDFGTPMTQQWSIGPLISWTLPSSARTHASTPPRPVPMLRWPSSTTPCCRRCAETQTALDRYAQDLRRLRSLRIAQEQAALAAEQNRRLPGRPHAVPVQPGCRPQPGHQRRHPGGRRSAGLARPDPPVPGAGWWLAGQRRRAQRLDRSEVSHERADRPPGLAVLDQDLPGRGGRAVHRHGRQPVAPVLGDGHGVHRQPAAAGPDPRQGRVPHRRHPGGRPPPCWCCAALVERAGAERGDVDLAGRLSVHGPAQPRAARLRLPAAGYTTAFIGFPAVTSPETIFDTVVARSEEIILGTVVVVLFASLLFPASVRPMLRARIGNWMEDAAQWCRQILERGRAHAPRGSAGRRPGAVRGADRVPAPR